MLKVGYVFCVSIPFERNQPGCYNEGMLQPVKIQKPKTSGGSFAIVASQYNARFVDVMLRAAKTELLRAGAKVQILRVPGAYEIPVVVKRLSRQLPQPSAIICLGIILRGETTHAAHIGEAVSNALMQLQIMHEIPIIHEVLLLENEAQARARCLDKKHNRGIEAAQTALAMARVMQHLNT